MLKSNSKQFLGKLEALVIDTINCEDGDSLEDNLKITLESLKAAHAGEFGRYPILQRPALVSAPSLKYFINIMGGHFEYRECKQIEELADLYSENEAERKAYIDRWTKTLESKGYEPILEHYSCVIAKGLERVLRAHSLVEGR